jgi:hypothetical protein
MDDRSAEAVGVVLYDYLYIDVRHGLSVGTTS